MDDFVAVDIDELRRIKKQMDEKVKEIEEIIKKCYQKIDETKETY